MKFYLSYFLFITLLFPNLINSQNNKEKIAKALSDYFHLERETIHVHFNKNIFLTNEQIWFKGYVFHRKLNTPFFATTNIYANLIDSDGKIIETQLLYGNIATFSGSFKLNDSFKSGKYYLQFYTNWMNNFTEDESAVYELEVINPEQGIVSSLGEPDYSKINISFNPEGGTLLEGVSNSVGIRITDCNNKPVVVSSLNIVNQKAEILKTVQINKFGYGRFDLLPNNSELKAIAIINGVNYEQALPRAQLKGLSLEANNYSFADKMIVKIKTNNLTSTSFSGKPLYMVIQQDEKALIVEFNFKDSKLEQTIAIPETELFQGTNTIRILDADLNQMAERFVFKYPKSGITTSMSPPKQTADFTEVTAKIGQPLMNLSVSILPENTISIDDDNDIYGSLLISPYLDNHERIGGKYYFETLSKSKQYELDLFLLNQTGKYKWKDILQNPPKSINKFDMGLALKATLNNNIRNKKDHKIRIYSLTGMFDEHVEINDKGEVNLDNLILTDSTMISFSLLEKGIKKEGLKLYTQLLNNNRKFNKSYKPAITHCSQQTNGKPSLEIPGFTKNTIILGELEITGKRTPVLKHYRAPGNAQLRGYKITDTESRSFFYILDYIRYHGFDVVNDGITVGIFGRTVNTINGQRTTPQVFLDNMQVRDFTVLQGMQTEDVDELYINQHAVVPSLDNRLGIIKIFMKKDFSYRAKKSIDPNFYIKDGFEEEKTFENAQYISTSDKGFENFGLIDWQPVILPDANGEFIIKIPRTSQKTMKILIEGFSADGKLLSEIKTIKLN